MVTHTKKRDTPKKTRRPFNTVNVRQCSMICEKDEIVFSFFLSLALTFFALIADSAMPLNNFEPIFCLRSLFFFDDTIKTMGERGAMWSFFGDFKVFSLHAEVRKLFVERQIS
jgi:hypothetical protein